jgi:hypothetical protein
MPSAGYAYIISMPFTEQCCQFEGYFAGVYMSTVLGYDVVDVMGDDAVTVPPKNCYTYNDWGSGWADLNVDLTVPFGLNLELWSEGNTYDQNSCPGTPGVCHWESFYNGIAVYSTDPDANGSTDRFVRFNPAVECTLTTAGIVIYDGGNEGTPTARVRVYGNNGPIYAGRMYPGAFGVQPDGTDPNVIFETDIPYGSMTFYPGEQIVDFSVLDPNWPTGYVYGTGENCFVSMSLSPATPDPLNDVIAFMADGGPGAGHSGSFVIGDYYYNDEVYTTVRAWALDAYFCCQYVPVVEVECSNPGPDDWPTWGHDYNRTCATSINVGDPCQITAAWSQPMAGGLNSFNNPTVANNTVYSSVDNKLFSFDLTSGTPGNTVSGLPYIYASNRGNMTIDGGNVYVTGGNGQSISKWDATLTTPAWVNGLGAGNEPALGGQCRFGVTAVYTVGADEVVVVGTETGNLWCFKTSDGSIFPGWATNPVVLPNGVYHSPSYDGTDLYVGTSTSANDAGEIMRIDATDGSILWTFTPTAPDQGWVGGVSLDGGYVYGASSDADGNGVRVKIDKSTGVADWEFAETRALYACPAIGRSFVYIGQDGLGAGVLVVDKSSGAAVYNFAANGVDQVTQPVTITCDNYLFAGDRLGNWWLLNINDQVAEFSVPFYGIVMGTAVASDGTDDFAVISIRSGNDVDGGGYVAAFKFNAGVRPRLVQNAFGVDIPVPFGTVGGNAFNQPDIMSNVGCADMNITSYNLTDPAPDVSSKSYRDAQSRYAQAAANRIVGADYSTYFDNSTKSAILANRPLEFVDNELTRGDVAIENARKALVESKRSSHRMAAGAQIIRTSAITYTTPVAAGSSTDLDFVYDGTALERGIDVEEIEFITDDPDRIFFGNQPLYTITYIGGCLDAETWIDWNTLGAANSERITNTGKLGDNNDAANNLLWGADPYGADAGMLYEGSFFLAGPVAPNVDTAQWYIGDIYGLYAQYNGLFRGNPAPGTDQCRFDETTDVHLGWKRADGSGCPGTPEEIMGAWTKAYYVDTNATYAGTPYAAIGLTIAMTEIGSYDPAFGDFSIIKWDLTERNGNDLDPVYGGTYMDWDVPGDYEANYGIVSDDFNGYAMWDWNDPGLAYGMLDPRMSTDYCGLNTSEYSPHRIQEMGRGCPGDVTGEGCGAWRFWQETGPDDLASMWDDIVNGPARLNGPYAFGGYPELEDHAGMLTNAPVHIGPYETKSIIQAKFAVDASTGVGGDNGGVINSLATELGRRAAIWTGFARGDANMDGCVNLIDVCWVTSGNQIYPDTYNGDVDLSGTVDSGDASYLLDYVTGLGPAPQGAWRFAF